MALANLTLSVIRPPMEFETLLDVISGIILLIVIITGIMNLTIIIIHYKARPYSAYNLLIMGLVAVDTMDALILSPLWLATLTNRDGMMTPSVCTISIVLSTFTFLGHHILIPTIACMRLMKGLYISLNPRTLKIFSYAGLLNCLMISTCGSIIRLFVKTTFTDQLRPMSMSCTFLGGWNDAENGNSVGWVGLFVFTLLSCIITITLYIVLAKRLRQQQKVSVATSSRSSYFSYAKSMKSGMRAVIMFIFAYLPIYLLPWITHFGLSVLITSRTITSLLVSITLLIVPMNAAIYVWKTPLRSGLTNHFPRKLQSALQVLVYRNHNDAERQTRQGNAAEVNSFNAISSKPCRINEKRLQFKKSLSLSESLPPLIHEAHQKSNTEVRIDINEGMSDDAVNLNEIRMEELGAKDNRAQVRPINNTVLQRETLKKVKQERHKMAPTLMLVKECGDELNTPSTGDRCSDNSSMHGSSESGKATTHLPSVPSISASVQENEKFKTQSSISSYVCPVPESEDDSSKGTLCSSPTWSSSAKRVVHCGDPTPSEQVGDGVLASCPEEFTSTSLEGLSVTRDMVTMDNTCTKTRNQCQSNINARSAQIVSSKPKIKAQRVNFFPQTKISHFPMESSQYKSVLQMVYNN
ncbi:unnamed protein product [Owenia fusiformis]|uniref:Uncharacterized protein n=1 Tax=Owenia fusiformis TaxID=6347 RepID=A0A8J1Y671_OWEFU|nr:unnamed protein product [Owenia fusiformis]